MLWGFFFSIFADPFLSLSDMVIIKTWFQILLFFLLEWKSVSASHPAAETWLSSPSQERRPRCRWTGGILGCNRSHPWSTPEPVMIAEGRDNSGLRIHFSRLTPLKRNAVNVVAWMRPRLSSGILILFCASSASRVRNRTFHEHVCFSAKALSRPAPCTLSVTAVCKVWSDSWVIVLK